MDSSYCQALPETSRLVTQLRVFSGNFTFLIVILILIQMTGAFRKLVLTGVLAFAAGAFCQAGYRGVPPSNGITNFGRVNDLLYRGAQPDAAGLAGLKALGVKTITECPPWNAA
jgi:hypothetical protein